MSNKNFTRPTDEEFARCERQAKAVARALWSTMTNEQIDELTDHDPHDPDCAADGTRWERLFGHVYTSILGTFHFAPDFVTRAPENEDEAGRPW